MLEPEKSFRGLGGSLVIVSMSPYVPTPSRNECCDSYIEIAPEPTGHGLPLIKCEAYNRVHDQPFESR